METAHGAGDNGRAVSDETAARRKALFDQYVMPYHRMIYKLCMRYTFDASDTTENYWDVLTNMYKYIETYDPNRPVRTWLHIVTKRCVFELDRRRQRHYERRNRDKDIETYESEEDYAEVEATESCDTVDISNYRELYDDDIVYALEQLKPSYRRALLLQQAGYKLKEIAEIEYRNGALDSRNIETVKSRLFLARQQLQQLLTRDGKRRTTEEANQDGVCRDNTEADSP